jgi:hypothetical protein
MYFNKNTNCIILKIANATHWLLRMKCKWSTLSIFEGAYAIWKGQMRFVRFMDQPNIVNIENSEIGVLLELSHMSFTLKKKIRVSLTIINVEWEIRCIWFNFYFNFFFFCVCVGGGLNDIVCAIARLVYNGKKAMGEGEGRILGWCGSIGAYRVEVMRGRSLSGRQRRGCPGRGGKGREVLKYLPAGNHPFNVISSHMDLLITLPYLTLPCLYIPTYLPS